MPFHTNPNTKSQRTRWLENFYPKFSDATRKLIRDGFNQTQIAPPMAIYFPDNLTKSKEEVLQDLLSRVTGRGGGGGGDVPPVGPEDPASSTDSNGEPSSTTDTPDPLSTTGGGGTTGSNGSGTGITTSGDYTTSETGSPTDEGSTTGGGGTTMSGGVTSDGYTTYGSGTISVIPPDSDPEPPPDTGGSGTSDTGYDALTCDTCLSDPTVDYPTTCKSNIGGSPPAFETTDYNSDPISVLWKWSDCWQPENTYYNSTDAGGGVCDQGEPVCPFVTVSEFYVDTLCSCAIVFGCGTVGVDANCFDPIGPGLYPYCTLKIACCFKRVAVLGGAGSCFTTIAEGYLYTLGGSHPCRVC